MLTIPTQLPDPVDAAWSQPIDRFIGARLRQAKLSPSPRADKATLLRQGFECHLPLVRTQKRSKGMLAWRLEPLFPRYLFLRPASGAASMTVPRGQRDQAQRVLALIADEQGLGGGK